ncbi:unnamed protein product [Closterium sp. NIES-64]|nr:unnamed protein product [Closterium sp. NIES-64]
MRKVGVVAEAEQRAVAALRKQTPLVELRTAPTATERELHTSDALRAAAGLQTDVTDELRCPRLAELYEVGRELGRGHFGVVRLCEDRATGERFACKTILLSGVRFRRGCLRRYPPFPLPPPLIYPPVTLSAPILSPSFLSLPATPVFPSTHPPPSFLSAPLRSHEAEGVSSLVAVFKGASQPISPPSPPLPLLILSARPPPPPSLPQLPNDLMELGGAMPHRSHGAEGGSAVAAAPAGGGGGMGGGEEQGAGEQEKGECGAGSADGEREELEFVRLYEVVVEMGMALHLILEYYLGGDLFDLVIRQKRLTEAQAAAVFSILSFPPASSPPPSPALPPSSPSPALPPSSPFHLSQTSQPPSPSPSSPHLSLPPSFPTTSPPPPTPSPHPLPLLCSSPPPTHSTTATKPPPCPCTGIQPPPCTCTGIRVRVADFGLAATLSRGQTAACGVVGSPFYMAREIIRGRPYAGRSTCGASAAFSTPACSVPFQGRTHCEVFASVLGSAPDLKGEVWEGISREAKQLLRCLLATDPGRRLKAHEVLNHPWVRAACGGECCIQEREWRKEKKRDDGEGVVRKGDCKNESRSGKGLTAEGKVSGGVVHVEKACVESHSGEGADGQHVVGHEERCPVCQASNPHTCCQTSHADAADRLVVQEKVGKGASRNGNSAEMEQMHGLARGGGSGRSISTAACGDVGPTVGSNVVDSSCHGLP